ncbi:hypothetical protein BTO06_11970 [Tenacibaculum sp. SZ-18]|uniref:DMP19 family protein n=1 Tax=Tenacibaculum sp. SZ-18 TaxID=754423 RepID=UPI000C2D5C7F|nr:DUF4375 domain-containing protein [Tenacibaculum sp. SZ-18]AUC15820.1 hypothetical protein BTO06_11970 [Tenacibaculum sp. SZ-18]
MFKKLGKHNKRIDIKDEIEYLSQLDEYNEIDFENTEIKKQQPTEKSDIDYSDILNQVEEFKNRKVYKNLDLDTLENTEDKKLIQVIFDNLTEKIGSDYENELEIIKSFNIHRQVIYSIWIFNTEIENGGLLQFYENSSGKFSMLAQESLKLIQANESYDLLREANNYFKSFKYTFGKVRSLYDSSFEFTKLNELENKYFKITEKENLEKLQIKYIRENIKYFID